MTAEAKFIEGLYVRVKFTTENGKMKQKLRKLPQSFDNLSAMADSLKAGKERVFTTEEGDDVENQEDWGVIVEALKSTEKKYLNVYLEDEKSSTSPPIPTNYGYTQQQPQKAVQSQPLFPPAPASKGVKRKLEAAPPSGKRMKLSERQRLKEEKRRTDLEKWRKVRESKTVPFDGTPQPGACEAGGLWFGQLCLICLRPVSFSSLMGHLKGAKHTAEFNKCPRAPTFHRYTPIIMGEDEAAQHALWLQEQQEAGYPIIYKCDAKKFVDLNCYNSDYRVLVLGEQDFSYGLGVAGYGCDVVATSYMEAHDPTIPDPVPRDLDDGAREVYQAKTLSSMDGDLEKNAKLADEKGVVIKYGIDANNMKETLEAKGVTGNYHCIVFPFPRYSLFRGNDPSNSLLIHGYFKSCLEDKMIQPGGIIQIVCLETQFREWDMYQIGEEAGLMLKYMVYLDFDKIKPYRSRDLLGKVFNPKDVILCVWQAPLKFPSSVVSSTEDEPMETEEIDVTKGAEEKDEEEKTEQKDDDKDSEGENMEEDVNEEEEVNDEEEEVNDEEEEVNEEEVADANEEDPVLSDNEVDADS